MEDLEASDLNEEKGESAIEGPIDELKDSERFISGGERSEETVRRLLWGVLYERFAIACVAGCLFDGVKSGAGFGDLQGPIHEASFVDGEQRWSKERRRAHSGEGAEYICLPRSVRLCLGERDMEHGGIVPNAGRSAYTI
jgi:hypothetical protein